MCIDMRMRVCIDMCIDIIEFCLDVCRSSRHSYRAYKRGPVAAAAAAAAAAVRPRRLVAD